MTPAQAKALKKGDRVCWESDSFDLGTVTDNGYCAVTVAWDNGQTGTLDHRDTGNVARYTEEAAK